MNNWGDGWRAINPGRRISVNSQEFACAYPVSLQAGHAFDQCNYFEYAAINMRTPSLACLCISLSVGIAPSPSNIARFRGADMISQLNCVAASDGLRTERTLRLARRSNIAASVVIVRPGPPA